MKSYKTHFHLKLTRRVDMNRLVKSATHELIHRTVTGTWRVSNHEPHVRSGKMLALCWCGHNIDYAAIVFKQRDIKPPELNWRSWNECERIALSRICFSLCPSLGRNVSNGSSVMASGFLDYHALGETGYLWKWVHKTSVYLVRVGRGGCNVTTKDLLLWGTPYGRNPDRFARLGVL